MDFLESNYLYLGLLLFSVSYPLAQSFEHRIQYYKKWKRLLPAIILMMTIFIPWDIWFAYKEVWWFNHSYTLGLDAIGLPLEEWLFFIAIPFACVFVFEVLNYFIRKDVLKTIARPFFICLTILLAMVAVCFHDQIYTLITFTFASLGLLALIIINPKWIGRFMLTYIVSLIPFAFINGALTGAFTHEAVVNYNPGEIIGIRIFTIPIEDSVYNLLLLLTVIGVYQYPE